MMHLIRQLIAFCRHVPYVPASKWNDEDARALLTFLGSSAGKKLRAHLLNCTIRANSLAVSAGPADSVRQCGVALGIQSAVSSIEALATISDTPEPETSEDIEKLLSP